MPDVGGGHGEGGGEPVCLLFGQFAALFGRRVHDEVAQLMGGVERDRSRRPLTAPRTMTGTVFIDLSPGGVGTLAQKPDLPRGRGDDSLGNGRNRRKAAEHGDAAR